MPDSKQTHHYSSLALKLLAIAPACYIAILIFKYSVNVPQWDEWELASFFEKFAHGALSLADLFKQQNEYRQFFPNLLFVGLGWLTRGDVRYEMIVSFLLACLISFNIYQLGKQSVTGGTRPRLWIYFSANLLIFSPIQYENWLQGQQVIYFAPAACLTTALLVASSARLRPGIKFLLCAALSLISTFSAANGILCFALLLPVLAWPWREARPLRRRWRRRWLLTGWLSAFALSAGVYFYHYHKPPGHPRLTEVLVQWRKAPLYFLALLGGPFGIVRLSVCIGVGLILVVLFVGCCWKFWRLPSDRAITRGMLCWWALGSYSIITAVLITVGRLGFGVGQALALRYTTFVIYLPVALVHLLPIILAHDKHPRGRFINKLATLPVAALLACVIIIASLPTYLSSIRYVSIYRTTLLRGKACMLFINTIQDECSTILYPDATKLRDRANRLDRLGFLRPPLLRGNLMRDIEGQTVSGPETYGSFVQVLEVGRDKYQASGWAVLPDRGEPADAVLLSLGYADGGDSVFAIATLETQRDGVSALLRRGTFGDARWHKEFSLPWGVSRLVRIRAWAFDSSTGKAYRLAGEHYIPKSAAAAVR